MKNSYRAAMERGLPHPIIYSLQFFSTDDGGFIWQRAIRSAGHFTYIILWYVHHLAALYIYGHRFFMLGHVDDSFCHCVSPNSETIHHAIRHN